MQLGIEMVVVLAASKVVESVVTMGHVLDFVMVEKLAVVSVALTAEKTVQMKAVWTERLKEVKMEQR